MRGEVVRLYAPDVTLQRPTRLVHPRYPIYLAPKQDHVFVIGATEIESDDLSPASVRSTLELLSAAYAVHPGFAEARILEIRTQCRPTLPDNLPAIRQPQPRVLEVNGMYRHGFMISPAMLDVTLEILNTGQSQLSKRFDLRFELLGQPAPPLRQPAHWHEDFHQQPPLRTAGRRHRDRCRGRHPGPAALRCRCQHQLCAQHALRSTRFAAGRPRRNHLPVTGG